MSFANPRLVDKLDSYDRAHRHPLNVLCHKVAMPFIVLHVVAMLDWVVIFGMRLSWVAYALVLIYYATLSIPAALVMALVLAPTLWLSRGLSVPVVVVMAIVAWTVQLIGHRVYEKNRPALVDNLEQALVGPLYFVAVALRRYDPSAS